MCNIYNIDGNTFKFELYNLNYFQDPDAPSLSGHYTFWYSKDKDSYVFCKHGDYANLVSIKPVKENPRFPTEQEKQWLHELISKTILQSYFYDRDASCNRGAFLIDFLESKAAKWKDGRTSEWFKHKDDEYFSSVHKGNCVFDVHYKQDWYKQYLKDKDVKFEIKQDNKAIKLLKSITYENGHQLTNANPLKNLEIVNHQFDY